MQNGEITIKIVAVANKQKLQDKVESHLIKYVEPYKNKINIEVNSYSWISNIKQKIIDRGIEDLSLIDPDCYSNVRNLCLLSVLDSGCDLGIFLDDDELIEDDSFFKIAGEDILNKANDNGIIFGKAGHYIQDRPSYSRFWELKWWPKDATFNKTFEKLKKENPRYKATMVALGGNMVLNKELIKNICFDPLISRGEDMDYVFNARLLGYRIYFDPQLHITHYPPSKKTPDWKKAREDIYRFLYLRKKYQDHLNSNEVHKIAFDEFMPYPGVFMKDDLEERISEHNKLLALKYLSENDKFGFDMCMENAKIPYTHSFSENSIEKLKDTLEKWQQITNIFLG
ncbi:MAG: hypothetical protein R6U52_02050 [Kosmotogaceae bacterium]